MKVKMFAVSKSAPFGSVENRINEFLAVLHQQKTKIEVKFITQSAISHGGNTISDLVPHHLIAIWYD